MVALEFISQLDKLRFTTSTGLDDFADKCSYMLSFSLVLLCFIIVTIKSYVFEPVSCYVPTSFTGSNFGSYINAFCWINGTIPIDVNTDRLDDQEYWYTLEDRKTSYYQWVSLVLALQAILCYLPRLVWEAIAFNRVGTNLTFLVELAQSASRETGTDRVQRVQFIARTLDTLLFARRDLKHPNGYVFHQLPSAPSMSYGPINELRTFFTSLCNLRPRKRLGSAIVSYYLITKVLYLFNAVGQLLLMQRFLGLQTSHHFFGLSILSDLINGRHWSETKIFPRVGFCRVPFKLTSTPIHTVTVQCALPVNILNEKIYVFLWFWFLFVATMESISIISWVWRLTIRQSRVRMLVRYLKIADAYDDDMIPMLSRFEMKFLRLDGSFLLQMLRINAGSIITQEVLQAMLKRYSELEKKAQTCQEKKSSTVQNGKSHPPSGESIDKLDEMTETDPKPCVVTKRVEEV